MPILYIFQAGNATILYICSVHYHCSKAERLWSLSNLGLARAVVSVQGK